MICPNCSVQMHQKEKVGGGEATSEKYETWEVKECGTCGRLVKEFYSATVITKNKLAKLMSEQETDIVYDEENHEGQ